MSKKGREFSREFKLEVCRGIVSGQRSKTSMMRSHQLSWGTLERWLAQYEARGEDSFDGERWRVVEPAEKEDSRLKRELEQLRLENEFLRACLGKLPEEPGTR